MMGSEEGLRRTYSDSSTVPPCSDGDKDEDGEEAERKRHGLSPV